MLKIKLNLSKVIAIAICLASSVTMSAQDIIVMKNGNEIQAVVQEVGVEVVKYKKYDSPNSPIYIKIKSEIFMIKYENGSKDVFSEEATPATAVKQKRTTVNQEISPYNSTTNSQQVQGVFNSMQECREERTSINAGLLMGGGGLIGADFEFLASKRVGLQLGGGIGSLGFGLNYHFKPCINSQFISIQYFHQGFGDDHYASYIGPMYVFRAKKLFQFGIGFGSVLTKGPRWEKTYAGKEDPSIVLLINAGMYFPL